MNDLITHFAFWWSGHEFPNYIPYASSDNYRYYQPSIESHKQKHINASHEKSKEKEDHSPHYLPERFWFPHSFFLFTWVQKLGVMATLYSVKKIQYILLYVSPLLRPAVPGKNFFWIAGIINITTLNKKDKKQARPNIPWESSFVCHLIYFQWFYKIRRFYVSKTNQQSAVQ